jgi:hypothetical protein
MAWRKTLSEEQQESVLVRLQSKWAWLRRRAMPTQGLTQSEQFFEDVFTHQAMNLLCECHKAAVGADAKRVRQLLQETDYYITQLAYLRVGRAVR